MSTRLRTWAMTGNYSDDPEARPVRAAWQRRVWTPWGERALAAALVPLGILLGVLLAVAFVVRLLTVPFTSRGGVPGTREE